MQGEVTALRGDVAHLFLALKAAESRHQQELAGVIIDAAQHQTQVSMPYHHLPVASLPPAEVDQANTTQHPTEDNPIHRKAWGIASITLLM